MIFLFLVECFFFWILFSSDHSFMGWSVDLRASLFSFFGRSLFKDWLLMEGFEGNKEGKVLWWSFMSVVRGWGIEGGIFISVDFKQDWFLTISVKDGRWVALLTLLFIIEAEEEETFGVNLSFLRLGEERCGNAGNGLFYNNNKWL